ncbi:MAG: hypothetical protein ACFE9I_17245 [Candidatus Hermodarchaeota archaeon]
MTESKKMITPLLKEFPKYKILDEKETITKKEVKVVAFLKHEIDPVQKKRDEKNWKESMGNYLLNPKKFKFGLKDLK